MRLLEYIKGDKKTALSKFEEVVKENQSNKASRGWIGRISGELEKENTNNNTFKK